MLVLSPFVMDLLGKLPLVSRQSSEFPSICPLHHQGVSHLLNNHQVQEEG
jgi:hypothetical protein